MIVCYGYPVSIGLPMAELDASSIRSRGGRQTDKGAARRAAILFCRHLGEMPEPKGREGSRPEKRYNLGQICDIVILIRNIYKKRRFSKSKSPDGRSQRPFFNKVAKVAA